MLMGRELAECTKFDLRTQGGAPASPGFSLAVSPENSSTQVRMCAAAHRLGRCVVTTALQVSPEWHFQYLCSVCFVAITTNKKIWFGFLCCSEMPEVQSRLHCSFLKEKAQEKLAAESSWERQGWQGGEENIVANEGAEPPPRIKPGEGGLPFGSQVRCSSDPQTPQDGTYGPHFAKTSQLLLEVLMPFNICIVYTGNPTGPRSLLHHLVSNLFSQYLLSRLDRSTDEL